MKKTTEVLRAVCVCLIFASTAQARTLVVTNTDDHGAGSLRNVIASAWPGDEVLFDPSLDGELIVLGSPLLVYKALAIVGRGADKTIIDADSRGPVLRVRVPFGTVHISGVTLTGGLTDGDGGGVDARGSLRLTDCVVSGNVAGGAGGGIYLRSGALVVSKTTISGNTAGYCGGGLYLQSAEATLSDSTVARNVADNNGGGIFSRETTLTLKSCTLSGNSARHYGGGIFQCVHGTITLNGCTVSDNSSDPSGGSIDSRSSGHVTLSRSIVGGQSGGSDCFGGYRITSRGYNLDSDGSCHLTHPTDTRDTDPILGPLADNGGPTWTHALLEGGPAIDAGSCPGEVADQRGFPRPADVLVTPNADDGCDIGAFEYQPSPFPPNVEVVGDLYDLILVLVGGDNDLVAPLQEAIQILEDGDSSNDSEAVGHLQAFIAEVEERRGWTLSGAQADRLIAEAQRIIALLNLGGSSVGNS